MGGAWGKLRYELQQSGGNRAQVRAGGLSLEAGQGLMVVEGEVGTSRSTFVGVQSPAAVGKERQKMWGRDSVVHLGLGSVNGYRASEYRKRWLGKEALDPCDCMQW